VERLVIRGVSVITLFVAAVSVARHAHAAERREPLWWIEAEPWPCTRYVAALAREVELACDASGSACHVAAREDTPTMRAVLACAADGAKPWTLSALTNDGDEVWTLTLEGELEERLRKAALWIARTPVPEPPPAPPVVRGTSPPAVLPESPTPEPPTEAEPPPPPQAGEPSFDGFYRVGGPGTVGAGVRGAAFLRGSTRWGVAAAVAKESSKQAAGGTASTRDGWTTQVGAVFAVGAPSSDRVVGIALEGGLAVGTRNGQNVTTTCTPVPDCNTTSTRTSDAFVTPYFAGSFVLQIPTRLPINSWTATTVTWDPLYAWSSQFFFTFSVGLSWRAW
jgi:hypothetical protein